MKKVSLIISAVTMTLMMLSSCGGGASKEVTIGNQVWMAEDLNVDKFRNGDTIPEAKTDEEWKRAGKNGQPAWCYYENDPTNAEKYGKLYNWYAVSDSRGLAPEGWHIPSDEEWTVLTDFLGGADVAGTKMKSNNGWEGNGSGTNESGFSGLPGGSRNLDGEFKYIGKHVHWWSSSECSNERYVWTRPLAYYYGGVYRNGYDKEEGLSVRCLRD